MLRRILTGAILVVILIPVLLFSHTLLLNLTIALVSMVCIYEALISTKYVESKQLMVLSMVMAAVMPFLPRLSAKWIMLMLYVYALVLFVVTLINFKTFRFEHICVVFLLSIIIPYFLTNIIYVRQAAFGQYYIFLVFMGAWVTDTFAFFTGKLFGKHKLAPDISPKKTVEGSLGGIVFTVLSYLIFGLVISTAYGHTINYPLLALLGAAASVVSQVGDLSASVIKRTFGIKDFGTIFPGHGGMYDRFDSIIFVAPLIHVAILLQLGIIT